MSTLSFTAWCHGNISRLSAAQEAGDQAAAAELVATLRAAYDGLAERRVGTEEEQNSYLLARYTRTPVPELIAVGIDTNTWPMPVRPQQPGSTASEAEASPETSQRISDLFAAVGPLRAPSADKPRYTAEYRPEDQQKHRGVPLPWAIVDTLTGIAISYHSDPELTEYQADRASAAFRTFQGGRGQA